MSPAWLTHIEIQPKDMYLDWLIQTLFSFYLLAMIHLAYSVYGIQIGSLDSLMALLPPDITPFGRTYEFPNKVLGHIEGWI